MKLKWAPVRDLDTLKLAEAKVARGNAVFVCRADADDDYVLNWTVAVARLRLATTMSGACETMREAQATAEDAYDRIRRAHAIVFGVDPHPVVAAIDGVLVRGGTPVRLANQQKGSLPDGDYTLVPIRKVDIEAAMKVVSPQAKKKKKKSQRA